MTWDVVEGDCLDLLPELCPDPALILTDPPYGTQGRDGYASGGIKRRTGGGRTPHFTIAGDTDISCRDAVLALYPTVPAIVFGSALRPPPTGARQVLAYRKASTAGAFSPLGGWRRDIEIIYLCGLWPRGAPERSSLVATAAVHQGGGPSGLSARYGHPHAKPLDVLAALLASAPGDPEGLVLDPFCGSGTTLLAARLAGRPALGIEIDSGYVDRARRNLAQDVLL